MRNAKRKLRLLPIVAGFLGLALTTGCKGFFVNAPNTVTVSPNSPSLTSAGQTQSFKALATFSDNTTKDVTSSATWSTSDSCLVAIIGSGTGAGNATAVGTGGSATITASYNGISGTATATTSTGLTISPCQPQKAVQASQGSPFFPQVVFNVGEQGIVFTSSSTAGSITWTSSNTNIVNFASSASGAATFVSAGPATITANDGTQTGTLAIVVQ